MRRAAVLGVLLTVGCGTPVVRQVPPTPATVPARIAAEGRVVRGARDARARARAYRARFELRTHPANPEPDYLGALGDLEALLVLDPAVAEDPEVRRWLGVLRGLREAEQARARWERRAADLEAEAERARARAGEVGTALHACRGEATELRDELRLSRAREAADAEACAGDGTEEELRARLGEIEAERRKLADALLEERSRAQELSETVERLKSLDLELEKLRKESP